MSNETRAETRRDLRMAFLARSLLVGAAVAAAAALAAAPARSAIPCTTGPTFNLRTMTGFIDTPDGNSVFMWGYAKNPGAFQIPGPVLCVTEGQTVTVNLTNTLSEPASIVFPGQAAVTTSGGVAGLFTREAAASGGTVTYTFVADEPGTYLYESGTNPHKQVHMGLYGALIVRPAGFPNRAYADAATQFDTAREYLLVLHDIDPFLHQAVERGETYDVTVKHDRYWTINGRAFPDTILDDGAPTLPGQPFGALVTVQASSCPTPGTGCAANDPASPALIRYANAGMVNHPFHPHGNHLRVIARDGRLLGGAGIPAAMEAFTKTIGSGQTFDLLVRFVDEQEFTAPPGNEIPVTVPGLQNLVFKDDVTFYSGSPYLGEQGEQLPTTTSFNECGEFYYPWHSHALNEFNNFDEGFGGLATMFRVDPPAPNACP